MPDGRLLQNVGALPRIPWKVGLGAPEHKPPIDHPYIHPLPDLAPGTSVATPQLEQGPGGI